MSNRLDPDQDRLGQNCLHRFSADDKQFKMNGMINVSVSLFCFSDHPWARRRSFGPDPVLNTERVLGAEEGRIYIQTVYFFLLNDFYVP